MGFLELLLILILGVIFIGPDKLPEMAAKAGQLFRSFKKTTFDLTKSITEELPTKNVGDMITREITPENKAENTEKSRPGSGSKKEAHEQ
ncbi:MAG: twin-arginine translocase TatA/TatE family subunit [Dehalococcoidia bacterium]|nr:twin-arginine translocase TatA/TatE family subunit [Dehalococcoidia bacterium]